MTLDTIAATVTDEQVVNRSRFLATLAPVADEAGADAVIAAVRREHPGARHHGVAMVLGPDGQRQRSSDDGEPAGTTGAPMLAVLRGAALTDVVAVVTRYFGGTLLGAGGLVRAYGGTLSGAVARAQRIARVAVVPCEVRAAHADAGRLEHRLHGWVRNRDVVLGPTRYDAEVAVLTVEVPQGGEADLASMLAGSGIAHTLSHRQPQLRARPRGSPGA